MKAGNKEQSWGRFDFMKVAPLFTGISALAVVASLIYVLGKEKINYGIDFAGGTEIQVLFAKSNVSTDQLRQIVLKAGYHDVNIQTLEGKTEFILRFESQKGATESDVEKAMSTLAANVSNAIIKEFPQEETTSLIRRVDTVGPTIGDELKRNSLLAGFYSLIVLLIYVGLRYDFKYSTSAILCVFHDAIVAYGIFVLMGKEVNVQTLAAVLTLIGFSLNDTIVTYDRIRENLGTHRDAPLANIINLSINEMLSRTILTSGTVFMSIMALYFLAGGVVEDFALIMLIGVVIGVYSSVYVASPLVLVFERLQSKHQKVA
ncbi:MAG: hypothetical protein A4S09_05350 [Proteobacteria bacterium SG_bin7]|nr:MAG: hypothetical protein A4S09_05350 [Proteobacteria bacterium SG_bin7]